MSKALVLRDWTPINEDDMFDGLSDLLGTTPTHSSTSQDDWRWPYTVSG